MRVQYLFRQCIYTMLSIHVVAKNSDWESFEFGREAVDGLINAEIEYRNLVEEEFFAMSMSMSMSMPMSYEEVARTTPSPTEAPTKSPTKSPTVAPSSAPTETAIATRGVVCDEDSQYVISFDLEVETAIGKTEFTDDLVRSLTDALSKKYSFCDIRRRLRKRNLEDSGILLGQIDAKEVEGGSCTPQNELASACTVASLDFRVSGGDEAAASDELKDSLSLVFQKDEEFDDEIYENGIVAVRLKESGQENALNTPTKSTDDKLLGRPAFVSILVIAACAVLISAFILQKFGIDDEKDDSDSESEFDTEDEETLAATNASTMANTVPVPV